ncbi:MAG: hypothetical protein ACR2OD_01280 [Gaiellaceae bacterium]
MKRGLADCGSDGAAEPTGGALGAAAIGVLGALVLASSVLLATPERAFGAAKQPAAAVRTTEASVNADRRVRLLLRCNRAGVPCRGKLVLKQAGGKQRLGAKSFRIRSGRGKLVTVRLSRAGYAQLQAAKEMRVRAIASTKRSQGKAKKKGRTVALVVPAAGVAPSPSPPAGESGPDAAADRARASRIALKLSELPSGWEASADARVGSTCSAPASNDISGRHAFELFRTGLATSAGSDVSVMLTQPAAIDAYNRVPPLINECFTDLVGTTIDGATIDDATIKALASPGLGERSRAVRIELDANSLGFDFTVAIDVVYVQRERAFTMLLFTELGGPIDPALKNPLVSKIAARMAP